MGKEPKQDSKAGRTEHSGPNEAIEQPKRPYKTPRLTTYGNLRQLSLQKGLDKADGGVPSNPKSRL